MDRNSITELFIKRESNKIPTVDKVEYSYEKIINSSLGYLVLQTKIPYATIANEIKNIEHLFVPHRDNFNESKGWLSFCIHGKSYDSTREAEYYNNNRPDIWTAEAQTLMPDTVHFFQTNWFNNTFRRLRIMKLLPGGYINCHSDLSKPGKLNPVNIAINNPDGNVFVMEKWGTIPFSAGKAIMLNVSNLHAVQNNSDEPRYHMILHHAHVTETFKQTVVDSYRLLC